MLVIGSEKTSLNLSLVTRSSVFLSQTQRYINTISSFTAKNEAVLSSLPASASCFSWPTGNPFKWSIDPCQNSGEQVDQGCV